MEKSNKEMLAELIQKHPELPVVFFCPAELEYNKTMLKDFALGIQDVYVCDDYVYNDYDSVFEYMLNKYADTLPAYLSDEHVDKYIEKKINELEHYEAICVDIID